MQIIDTRQALQTRADELRSAGRRIGLVPTMGALHAGHLSLVEEARKRVDEVVVSIFVNPTQFNQAQDFDQYPRVMENDLSLCRSLGVECVYTPPVADLYPAGAQTWVEVTELAEPLCGATRPGHFRGVTSVVTKLLLAAKPHVAVFGQKDYQQLAVIRRMVCDLGFDVEIVGGATVREPDGLALSSRNVHLGPIARQQATALVRALDSAEAIVGAGGRDRDALLERVRKEIGRASQAEIDYAELRDPDTLEPAPRTLTRPALLALAVFFRPDLDGRGAPVRLIDNRVLETSVASR